MGGAIFVQGLTTDHSKVVSLSGMCIPASLVEYSEQPDEILQERDHVSHCYICGDHMTIASWGIT